MSSIASQNKQVPRIVITPGEPAGIGPELVVMIAQQPFAAELIVCADPDLLHKSASACGLPIKLEDYNPESVPKEHKPGTIKILPVRLKCESRAGHLEVQNAAYVIECLKQACLGCLDNKFDAMTTGPVQKSIINDAGISFSGHTEFLAELCHNSYPVMLLANSKLKVALVTTHIPLSQVASAITEHTLEKTLRIVDADFRQRFGVSNPRILVCGLNPHAGEQGHLGLEEQQVITPVIEKLVEESFNINGPLPADTLFTEKNLKESDVIVSMFHDQGLPVLKALGFGETVNITLGLPIIRTSVDHGTALSLAGKGQAEAGSFVAAIHSAIEMVQNRPGLAD